MHTTTVCANCGGQVHVEDRFCGFCGTPQSAAADSHRERETPDPYEKLLGQLRSSTAGEYEIRGEIGRGGMAAVFLGYDLRLNRKVAIKVMLPELAYHERMDERFKQEARTAAKLDHPNIIVIYNVREAGDLLYFVMKYVDGAGLDRIIRTQGRLSIRVVQALLAQLGSALQFAHDEGVVHRDVKPANIIVDHRGTGLLTDFGIAKAAEGPQLTRTGAALGTPWYMSPEQCMGQATSRLSDQYSLGAVAYEMLTGRAPFVGTVFEIQMAHVQQAPVPVQALRPDCPPRLADAVMRMLAKSVHDRWPSLDHLLDGIGALGPEDPAARSELAALVRATPATIPTSIATTPASPIPAPAAVPAPRRARLEIDRRSVDLEVGESTQITAMVRDARGQEVPAVVEWATTDVEVADVSALGAVTARAIGRAEIIARVQAEEVRCAVVVAAPRPAEMRVSPPTARVESGQHVSFSATVLDARGAAIDAVVSWTSSDAGVGSVDANGETVAKAPGEARIVARAGNASAAAELTVTPRSVAKLLLSPNDPVVSVGAHVQFEAVALDSSGQVLADRRVHWDCSAPDVAKVDRHGIVTARREGNATVSVTCDGASASAHVVVRALAPVSLRVSPATVRLRPNKSKRLRAVARDERAAVVDSSSITWASENPGIARVTDGGDVIAEQPGTVRIFARLDSLSAETVVDVMPARAAYSRGRALGVAGVVVTLVVAIALWFSDALRRPVNVASNAPLPAAPNSVVVAERSIDAPVALPPTDSTARREGDRQAGTTGGASVDSANRVPSAPVSLNISPENVSLEVGERVALELRQQQRDGRDSLVRAARWSSSDSTIARVSSTGNVVAVSSGQARITAQRGTSRSAAVVLVRPARPADVVVTIERDSLLVGDMIVARASVTDARGRSLPDVAVSWRTEVPTVASVSLAGEVRALVPGETRLVARAGDVQQSVRLVVSVRPSAANAAPPTNLPTTPAPAPKVEPPQPNVSSSQPVLSEADIGSLAESLARLIEQRREAPLRSLLKDDKRTIDAFLGFLRLNRPAPVRVTDARLLASSTVDAPELRIEAALQWRTLSGTQRRTAVFTATAQRSGGQWMLSGARFATPFAP